MYHTKNSKVDNITRPQNVQSKLITPRFWLCWLMKRLLKNEDIQDHVTCFLSCIENAEKKSKFNFEDTHLKTIISPRSKFHVATLLIKRKPLHIDFARTFVDCWRLPFDFSSIIQSSFGHQCHLVFSISTKIRKQS